MLRSFLTLCLFLAAFVSQSAAQDMTVVSDPPVGQENTVPAGAEIYSFVRLYAIDGFEIDAETKAGFWLQEERLPQGTKLVPVETTKAAKACVPQEGTLMPTGPCFIDDDGDGTFDRHSGDEAAMFRKLKPPVAYSKARITVARQDSFRSAIIYQGATSDSLRFSYREFSDGLARPAFTEDLAIPRETLPAMVMIKNLQVEVLGVTGMGLTYRITKVN